MIRRIIHKQGLRQATDAFGAWASTLKGPVSFRLGVVSYAMVIRSTVKNSSLRVVDSNSKLNPNKSHGKGGK